ncbi:hypothetical protein DES34_10189 [Brevibacillus brevis]|nr:hypothetical protein DES34_10189 [Brevibacillus brevis]VEF89458.1 Uncharacterised protein [Brevibacillus brevis]
MYALSHLTGNTYNEYFLFFQQNSGFKYEDDSRNQPKEN